MKCTITIVMNSSAFQESLELSRILSRLASELEFVSNEVKGRYVDQIRDINGNNCGKITIDQ